MTSSFDPRYRQGNLAGNITIALYRISQAITLLLRDKGQAHHLSPAQLQALLFFTYARPGVRTVGGLAQRLVCMPATASGVADALERKQLITRVPLPEDRRVITLRLTPDGEALAAQVDDVLDELETIVRQLPAQEQAVLLKATQNLVRGLVARSHIKVYEMCWNCGFFRHNAHPEDLSGPHHCAFMDAPLPEPDTYLECPDFVSTQEGGETMS